MTPVSLADLLPRRERILDMRPVAAWLRGRRVVVTGAGGFIGGELARQVAAFAPADLLCIDNSERGLWELGVGFNTVFADVRDGRRMRTLLRNADVVFHAAAMKHVPICEVSPEDAYATNAGGTWNVVNAAERAQVVLVSTDKAVRPTSVMGMTKKAAEGVVIGARFGTVVRFGNVIGSTGSVVPAWERQLAAGGPLQVTDPGMTRFMMTVGEAVELVLQAGALGSGTFVLDMGEAVRVADLAADYLRLSGRRGVDIVYTGVRPGEKLVEELSVEPLVESGIEGIRRVVG